MPGRAITEGQGEKASGEADVALDELRSALAAARRRPPPDRTARTCGSPLPSALGKHLAPEYRYRLSTTAQLERRPSTTPRRHTDAPPHTPPAKSDP